MLDAVPVLYDANGDLSKQWYIHYSVYENGQKKRVRIKGGINKCKTREARYSCAGVLISDVIKSRDNDGKPIGESIEHVISCREAFERIVHNKESIVRETSIKDYRTTAKVFLSWLDEYSIGSQSSITSLNAQLVLSFLDYLTTTRSTSNTTRNNYLTNLSTFFNNMMERKWIAENPSKGLKKAPQEIGRNIAFNSKQKTRLIDMMQHSDSYLLLYCKFIYYMYLRPTELRNLKVGDVDIENMQIRVRAEVAKNKRQATIDIPETFKKDVEAIQLHLYSLSDFIFTDNIKPGKKKIYKNYFSLRFRKVAEKVGLSRQYTTYSWKHTGVVDAYKLGIDIKSISNHCRHHSLEMTDIYLKSLGLYRDEKLINNFPKLM